MKKVFFLLVVILSLEFTSLPQPVQANTCDPLGPGQLNIAWDVNGSFTRVTNKTLDCIFRISLTSYKVYSPVSSDPNNLYWLFSQTFFDGVTKDVYPAQTVDMQVKLPDCQYQLDVYPGNQIYQPSSQNYGSVTNIKSRVATNLPLCPVSTPTPTPTVTPTPTMTATPTPTATPQPTATPTMTPTPTPSPQVYGDHTVYPPLQPQNTPSTGADVMVVLSSIPTALAGLIIRKKQK